MFGKQNGTFPLKTYMFMHVPFTIFKHDPGSQFHQHFKSNFRPKNNFLLLE